VTVLTTKTQTAHDAALTALIPADQREDYDRVVETLIARNRMLEVIEGAREREDLTKKELADRAGLDASSVRRLLTSKTGNPTSETTVRLLSALRIKLEAVLPSGDRIPIVGD
jgi:ribosome-binding protein aMBF1 (putative translation factor)